jgi:hypothetical protein
MPVKKANTYVVIRTRTYHSNGNITTSYGLKYFDENGLEAVPPDADTNNNKYVSSIIPIFYLRTSDGAAPQAPTAANVKSGKDKNTWTTSLPDKTKDNEIYYRGWKVTYYGGTADRYYGPKRANKLKKKPTMKNSEEDTTTIPAYIYATYKYKPDLYYEKIKDSFEKKLYADTAALETYKAKCLRIKELMDKIFDTINIAVTKKETVISNFEHMMGAALRESYWQPEDEY